MDSEDQSAAADQHSEAPAAREIPPAPAMVETPVPENPPAPKPAVDLGVIVFFTQPKVEAARDGVRTFPAIVTGFTGANPNLRVFVDGVESVRLVKNCAAYTDESGEGWGAAPPRPAAAPIEPPPA